MCILYISKYSLYIYTIYYDAWLDCSCAILHVLFVHTHNMSSDQSSEIVKPLPAPKPIYIFRSASNVSLCAECVSVRRTLCLLIELLWTISVWSSWVSAAFWYSMLTCMKCNSNRIVTQSTELSIARRVTSMHIYHLWVTTTKPKHERCRLPGRVLDSTYNKSIYIRYDDMNNTAIKLVWNQILILFLCISSVF